MSYSAGLLNVGSITLTDSAGTAASLNATTATVGTLNVNGNANVSTLGYTNLHAGNLDVSGSLTASGFSLDASGVGYFSNELKIQQPWLRGAKTSVNQSISLLNEQAQLAEDMGRSTLMQLQREKTLLHILEENCSFDYIVVGSGSGGGIAALTLALEGPKTGAQVLLIEKGQRRNPNIYHENPSATLSTYYYGKHYIEEIFPVDYNIPSVDIYLGEAEHYPWWNFNGDHGKTANFARGFASPNIFGGGSTINGGVVNAAPTWALKRYMPNVDTQTFSLCCRWVMDRIATGHNFGGGKYNKTLNHVADFWNYAFGAPQMYLAYEKSGSSYRANALKLQDDYQIFPLPGQSDIPENYRGFAVPEAGGFRMKMTLKCNLGVLYTKRRGVAYLLELYQGKNLSILTEVRGDRIVFQDLSGSQTVPEYDMSGNFLSGTQRVATGLVCTDMFNRPGTTTYPKEFTVNLKKGGEILLAGNVYHSPLLALRSGIGGLDASGWGARGITQTVKNPLVGLNYRNSLISPFFVNFLMNYNKIPNYDPLTDKVNFFSEDLQVFPNNGAMEYIGYFHDLSYNTVGDHGPDGLFNYHPDPVETTGFLQGGGAGEFSPQITFDENNKAQSVYAFLIVPGKTPEERQANYELSYANTMEDYISSYYSQQKTPFTMDPAQLQVLSDGISQYSSSVEVSDLGGVDGGVIGFKDADASGNYNLYIPKIESNWFKEYSDVLKFKSTWRKYLGALQSPAMKEKDASGNYIHLPQAIRKGVETPEELNALNNYYTFGWSASDYEDIYLNITIYPGCDDTGDIVWRPGASFGWNFNFDYAFINGNWLADTPNVYYYTGNDTSNNKVVDPSRNPINRKIGPSNFTNAAMFMNAESIHWTASMSKAVDSAFRVLGTSNVRVADSSVIKFPAICNSQGYCMAMGRYVALTTIGSILAVEPEPTLVNPIDILPRHFDSDYIKNNFIIAGGGIVSDSNIYKINYTNALIDVSGIKYGGFTYDYSGNITKHSYTWNYPSNMDGHHLDASGYVQVGDAYTCPWNVKTDISGNNYFEFYTTLPDSTPFDNNNFLCTSNNSYSNFIVSYEIQQFKDASSNTTVDVGTNSGFNFRSSIVPRNGYTPSRVVGWQVESANAPARPVSYSQTGAYYDEGGVRGFKGIPATPIAGNINKFNDWNKFTLQATTNEDGIPTYKTWLNGILVAQFIDNQADVWYRDNISHTVGCLGFQAHIGVPGIITAEKSTYRIRNCKIQPL
jgi:choline dehydrogenase-like flavoprotein